MKRAIAKAALPPAVRKASGFPRTHHPSSFPNLPQGPALRKVWEKNQEKLSERQSLSAQQAAKPLVPANSPSTGHE